MSASYTPDSLPEITSAEVVILRSVEEVRGSYMKAARHAPVFPVVGHAAQRMADLWRRLPRGEQARCHIPPFGLRFFSGQLLVCEASLCWLCNNIRGESFGKSFGYEFDAEATVSRQLLAECQQVAGIQADA